MAESAPEKKKPASKTKLRPKRRFRRQPIMEKVLIALIPCLLGAIYFFGWRVLVMLIWVGLWGVLTEFLLARRRGDPLTESCFVTCALFALSLPPTLPFWMAAVGIVVALLFGKEVFGGFGRNIFNPAIVGRGFLYVCFPIAMTARFAPVWKGGLAGFLHWGPCRICEGIDAVSAATPMWSRRDYGFIAGLPDMFFGNIGRTFTDAEGVRRVLAAGSVGEVSALLIILGGLYLLLTKTANWRLVLSSVLGASVAALIFRHLVGAGAVPPLLWTLTSGALLYACFFMVTDPVSAPKDKLAMYFYGAFIGVMIVFFRWKAVFAGGVAFAILLGNTVGPTIEIVTRHYADWKAKRRKAEESVPA
jgi:Na+-transporting NADH:ubiquinone oxidoreductase subunit B